MLEPTSTCEEARMPNGKTVQINLRLPEDEKAAIERAAYWARLSISDYVRGVLREAVTAKLEEFGERAPFLPGSGGSK
jgi:uncharacterized protein (DUF1778 family)